MMAKRMYFFIEDDDLSKKYKKIWEFDSKLVYDKVFCKNKILQ